MNKKLVLGSIIGILMLAAAVYAVSAFFHTTSATIIVNNARASADIPFTLSGYQGQTNCTTLTISNAANVPLNSILNYTVDSNNDSVTFTTTGFGLVSTNASETDVYPVCFTIDSISNNGTVDLTITYEKAA